MELNQTPVSERVHIGIFGNRNAGKSSLINAITSQELAIVSNIKGTTTDPVSKTMELLPLGPVVITDTPGLDDEGELGQMRIKKANNVLNKTDIALLVLDGTVGFTSSDEILLSRIKSKDIPFIVVWNKSDISSLVPPPDCICVSSITGENIPILKEQLAHKLKTTTESRLIGDILSPGDIVILVIPIDKSAPKGRLILPQQQVIRDILDSGAISIMTQNSNLAETLSTLKAKPRMVITDSQIFKNVSEIVPGDIPLTSFSILFARYKADLNQAVNGANSLSDLQDGDTILISEGCTHHRQCGDIGTVKLPNWIKNHTKKDLSFHFTSGVEFPDDLSPYKLIVHCGGCMLNEREMRYRIQCAKDQGVPITNYGVLIAHIHSILPRCVSALDG